LTDERQCTTHDVNKVYTQILEKKKTGKLSETQFENLSNPFHHQGNNDDIDDILEIETTDHNQYFQKCWLRSG